MELDIIELGNDPKLIKNVQEFLFDQIKKEFHYGYIPEYHYDIVNIADYYIKPERNAFFVALNNETDEVISTIGLRAYDKDFEQFRNIYSNQTTASIWRLFVCEKCRRCGLASKMFNIAENFAYNNNFNEIYLHTHKTLDGALEYWTKMGFRVVIDSNDELQTVHMDKKILGLKTIAPVSELKYSIEL